jgi:hypothetical protein
MPPTPDPDPGPKQSAYRRFVATVLAYARRPEPTAARPSIGERRRTPRLAAPPGTSAAVHLGAPGAGTDVALGLVDISENGAGVRLRTPVRPGEGAFVALWPPGQANSIRRHGSVIWCRPSIGGTFRAGVQFSRGLTADDLRVFANESGG